MPITAPVVTAAVASNIAAMGNTGIGVPQLAAGVAAGIVQWTPQIVVVTADVGTLGVGLGLLPVTIPSPSMLSAMLTGFASFAMVGVAAPLLVAGLSNGLVIAYSQGMIRTNHPSVGSGTAIATFRAPPAGPVMALGFKSVGMVGLATDRLAFAVGQALDTVFASLVVPLPIVGSVSPTSSSGVGAGNIL